MGTKKEEPFKNLKKRETGTLSYQSDSKERQKQTKNCKRLSRQTVGNSPSCKSKTLGFREYRSSDLKENTNKGRTMRGVGKKKN